MKKNIKNLRKKLKIFIVENMHTQITYPLKKPKKNPNIVSNCPSPEYLTALPIPLLTINIKKIIITKIPIPKIISKIYSLSIIPSTEGLILGKIINVNTYANNHFEAANKLKTKPFLEHFIKESIVKTM